MAIDTREKRASALKVGTRFPRSITPTGAITTADRQQIGWGYIGIPAAAPPLSAMASHRLLVGVGL